VQSGSHVVIRNIVASRDSRKDFPDFLLEGFLELLNSHDFPRALGCF
jgi:hypothetical protein